MRKLYVLFVVLIAFVSVPAQQSNYSAVAAAERPNILLITLDDMHWDSLGVTGCKLPNISPNIDQLAAEGMIFNRSHVTIAVCQPTRAVWMTGQYPHNNGAFGFERINPQTTTLLKILSAAGYYQGIAGKETHVVPTRRKYWDVIIPKDSLQQGRSAALYAKHVKSFFKQADASTKPFFLMVNTHDPHRPFAGSKQQQQFIDTRTRIQKRLAKQGKPAVEIIPFPEVINPYLPTDVPVPGFLPDLPDIRQELSEYFTSVRRADDVVGAVLKELSAAHQTQNTLVIFMSDHGMPLPFSKTNCYYQSTRTPLIIKWPGKVKPGSVNSHHFVHGIDITPTILDAIGLPPKKDADGRSILPILLGKTDADRDTMMTVFHKTAGRGKFEMRAVHSKRYYYIRNFWYDGKTQFRNESQSGLTMKAMRTAAKQDPAILKRVNLFLYRQPEELYDYENDPNSLKDLSQDPAHAELLQKLRGQLLQQMKRYHDPLTERFGAELAAKK